MTTTHAVDLLLRNLPPTARLGHRLPGLVNNLLSVATLVDAGCDVYFHRTGCEVSFDGKVILQGWRDPTNRLWRVRITDDGWTTNIRVLIPPTNAHEYGPPLIPLSMAPTAATDHLVNHIECHTTAPRRVTFTLSSSHIDRDSTEYRRGHHALNHTDRTVHPRFLGAPMPPVTAICPLSGPSLRGCRSSPSPLPTTAIANSLYECSNTHKLMHFYYACLNFPVKSTLLLAIKAGYLKGFPGLTADRVRRHSTSLLPPNGGTWTRYGRVNDPHVGSRHPSPSCYLTTASTPTWTRHPNSPPTSVPNTSSCRSTSSPAASPATKRVVSRSRQIGGIHIWRYSTFSTQII